MTDADGDTISAEDEELGWEQHGAQIAELLRDAAVKLSGDPERFSTIHFDTRHPDRVIEYPLVTFDEPRPELVSASEFIEPEPVPASPAPLGRFKRLFGVFQRDYGRRVEEARRAHEAASIAWRARRDEYAERARSAEAENRDRLDQWEERRRAHLKRQAEARDMYARRIRTDPDFMEAMLERALAQMQWPRETLVSLEVVDQGRTLFLDVDLPEVEDLPTRTAVVDEDRRQLVVKKKSQRSLRAEYARHVHGIGFRLAGAAFAVLPGVDRAVISGFSQRLNKATGRVDDEYLFSVDIDHDRFAAIDFPNLSHVDPIEALGAFSIRRKMSVGGTFRPIQPFRPETSVRAGARRRYGGDRKA